MSKHFSFRFSLSSHVLRGSSQDHWARKTFCCQTKVFRHIEDVSRLFFRWWPSSSCPTRSGSSEPSLPIQLDLHQLSPLLLLLLAVLLLALVLLLIEVAAPLAKQGNLMFEVTLFHLQQELPARWSSSSSSSRSSWSPSPREAFVSALPGAPPPVLLLLTSCRRLFRILPPFKPLCCDTNRESSKQFEEEGNHVSNAPGNNQRYNNQYSKGAVEQLASSFSKARAGQIKPLPPVVQPGHWQACQLLKGSLNQKHEIPNTLFFLSPVVQPGQREGSHFHTICNHIQNIHTL